MGKRIGYSYGRFSSGMQDQGDSTRRQDTGAAAWCKRHGVELDRTDCYMDEGTSAFRGKQRQAGSPLAAFLREVEGQRVPRGSVLIIENLDRLSRENPWDAVPLLCNIVNAGVEVVTLSPSEQRYTRDCNLMGLITAVVEFGRAHSESKAKSDRLTSVWGQRKANARAGKSLITRRLPAWVEVAGGKLVPRDDRVAVVRRIFEGVARGEGPFALVRMLTRDVPPWGRHLTEKEAGKFRAYRAEQGHPLTADEEARLGTPGHFHKRRGRPREWVPTTWSKAYVRKIITGRAVLGEHQPMKGGKPDGPPMLDYYPRVIDPGLWQAANDALAARRPDTPGAVGPRVTNLFSGMLTDARGGNPVLIAWQNQGGGARRRRTRALVPAGAMDGREPSVTLPYAVFEAAVLRCLAEIDPAAVYGEQPQGEVAALAQRRDVLAARMAAVEAELTGGEGGDSPALARALAKLDAEHQDVLTRLAQARHREARPAAANLAEARTLLGAAGDDTRRLRLRGLLQQAIEDIRLVVVPRRPAKLAVVQLYFRQGGHRTYLLAYFPGRRNVPTRVFVQSWAHRPADPTDANVGGPDLRNRGEAETLAADMAAWPQQEVDGFAAAAALCERLDGEWAAGG